MFVFTLALCFCVGFMTHVMTKLFTRQSVCHELWEKVAKESANGRTADDFRFKVLDIINEHSIR